MSKLFNRKILLVIGIILLAWLGYSALSSGKTAIDNDLPSTEKPKSIPVVTTKAKLINFERELIISGNVEAKNYALVSPRIPGVLDDIFVEEGDPVTAGETKLFQTDALTLQKQVEIASQQHAIAKCTVLEKKANHERIEADSKKAKLDYNRAKRLLADEVMPTSVYEENESRYQQAIASNKHAKVLIDLAEEQEKQEKLNFEIAQKNLRDSLAMAPISGVVTEKFKETGEMGIVGQPVINIVDLTIVEISGFVPQEYYAEVITGKTLLRVKVGTIDLGERTVTYISPTISNDLRTFEIKCIVKNPPSGVAPGGIAKIEIILDQHQALGVPRHALQEHDSGYVVFIQDNDIARKVRVAPGLETDGWTEILNFAKGEEPLIQAGTPVVSQGQRFLEDNSPITVVEEGN